MSKELDEITKENIAHFLKLIFTSKVFGFDNVSDLYESACVHFDNCDIPCGIISCVVSCKYPKYDDVMYEETINLSYADEPEIDKFVNNITFFWHRYNLLHTRQRSYNRVIEMMRTE